MRKFAYVIIKYNVFTHFCRSYTRFVIDEQLFQEYPKGYNEKYYLKCELILVILGKFYTKRHLDKVFSML